LYRAIDPSQGFYRNRVRAPDRSRMNVPFFLRDESLQGALLQGAQDEGLVPLRGHRRVGGLRASLYDAMSIDGVRALTSYMQQFARRNR
jgi:phosphoserine aminotransferase